MTISCMCCDAKNVPKGGWQNGYAICQECTNLINVSPDGRVSLTALGERELADANAFEAKGGVLASAQSPQLTLC